MRRKKLRENEDVKQNHESEDLPSHTRNLRDGQQTHFIKIHFNRTNSNSETTSERQTEIEWQREREQEREVH